MKPNQTNNIPDNLNNQMNKTDRIIRIVIISILFPPILAIIVLAGVSSLRQGVGIWGAVICWAIALGLTIYVVKGVKRLVTGQKNVKKRSDFTKALGWSGPRFPPRFIVGIVGVLFLFFGLSSLPPTTKNVTSITGNFDHYNYTTGRPYTNAIVLTDGKTYNVITSDVPFFDDSKFEVDKVFAHVKKGQPVELICSKAFMLNPVSIGYQVISAKAGDSALITYNDGANTAQQNFYFYITGGICLVFLSVFLFYRRYKLYQGRSEQ